MFDNVFFFRASLFSPALLPVLSLLVLLNYSASLSNRLHMDRNVTLSSDAKGIYGRIVPGLDVLLAGSAATLGTPQSIQYGAAIIHAVDHHTVNVVAPQDCRHYLWLGVSTKPDPHVAGTGVRVNLLDMYAIQLRPPGPCCIPDQRLVNVHSGFGSIYHRMSLSSSHPLP